MNEELIFSHHYFMKAALQEAAFALQQNEIPIGAIVVADGQIIGRGHNCTEQLKDVSAHAEMLALTAASNYLDAKYLTNCWLYVTVEPCIMCAGALRWAQLAGLVYGATEPKTGFSLYQPNLLHPKTKIVKGILATECIELIQSFFQTKRKS